MTVLTTDNRRAYTGDGSTSVYPFPVRFLSDADVKVAQRVNDEEVLLTIGTDYSVSGAGEAAGGSVTFVNAPAAGVPIVIYNDPPMTQDVDYQEDDEFPANTHERALDKLTILVQRLAGRLSRALLYDETADSVLTASQVLGRVGDAETARDQAQVAQVASESAKTDAEAARDAAQATAASVDGPTLQAGIDANTVAIAGKADQAAVDAVNTELDAILPDGATGTFTRPRMTTTARDALDMTGKAAGYEIYNTTTGQVEAWDGVSAWGPSSSGNFEFQTGDIQPWFKKTAPEGWSVLSRGGLVSNIEVNFPLPGGLSSSDAGGFELSDGRIVCLAAWWEPANPGFVFDPSNETFTPIPAPTTSRRWPNFAQLADERILMWGGANGSTTYYTSAEIYNPATNTWSAAASAPITLNRCGHILMSNGDVIFFGGYQNNQTSTTDVVKHVVRYNTSSNTWTDLGDATYRLSWNGYLNTGSGFEVDANTIVIGGGQFDDGHQWNFQPQKITLSPFSVTLLPAPSENLNYWYKVWRGEFEGQQRIGVVAGDYMRLWDETNETLENEHIQLGYWSTVQGQDIVRDDLSVWRVTSSTLSFHPYSCIIQKNP